MELPIYQVDAFTDRLFGGNPAAVVLLDAWLPDETLQAIAMENNLAETAFVVPDGDAFSLRWFSPEIEIDLCGHATLASAYVLFRYGRAKRDEIVFHSRGGLLRVKREEGVLAMDFPSRPAEPVAPQPSLDAALGAAPRELRKARDLMAVFETQEEIEALRPDIAALGRLDAFAVIVTAPGRDCDFVSRFFAPKAGVPEDPVTGSAHCTLASFWCTRLGRPSLVGWQASPRGGRVGVELAGDRVLLTGRAVTVLRGELL